MLLVIPVETGIQWWSLFQHSIPDQPQDFGYSSQNNHLTCLTDDLYIEFTLNRDTKGEGK